MVSRIEAAKSSQAAWPTDRHHHDHDGEIDFLIVHRELGLLILEVKGGRIRVKGESGLWYTKDRFDQETQLKISPFDQARKNLYALKDKLSEAPVTRPFFYRMQRGIALPDVNVGRLDIGLDGDRELIIDSTDLAKLYLVPVDDVGTTRAHLRLEPSKNRQEKNVRWARGYEL